MAEEPIDIIIMPHTHWDREWYWPFQRFRAALVQLVDHVLDVVERDSEFPYLFLDGQTSILEDYLEIRPENRERLAAQITAGRLGVGPWYTLPDECLVSGESLIRNLLLGHRLAARFGAVTKEGYCPDTFGHPSALPQILQGFGIDSFFFMRGLGEDVNELRSEFIWQAPDGSQVLAHFLSESYTNAAILRRTPEETVLHHGHLVNYDSLDELRDRLAARAATRTLLFMNGGDHLDVQQDLPALVQSLQAKLPDRLTVGTLRDFIEAVRAKVPRLRTYRGELLAARYFHVNLGCHSTRIYLKQRNAQMQTLLARVAEPLAAFARMVGGPDFRPLLWRAWRYLLQNHAHDSICGCSVDAVHEEMMERFRYAEQIGEAVARASLGHLTGQLETRAPNEETISVVVFNPLPWRRADLVDVEIVPVIGFPFGVRTFTPSGYREADLRECVLIDDGGTEIPFELGGARVIVEDPLNRRKPLPTHAIRFLARDVPGLGYRVFHFARRERRPSARRHRGMKDRRAIENEFFRVAALNDGRLRVEDKRNGATYDGLHYFEDSGDAGDEYAYAAPDEQETIESRHHPARARVEAGPDVSRLRIEQRLRLPRSLDASGNRRTRRRVTCRVSSVVTLSAAVPRIDIETQVDNLAKDHRLRAVFPTGLPIATVISDDVFAVIQRPVELPAGDDWEEKPVPTRPHQHFVAVEDGRRGLGVASVGLPEHEVTKEGVIYLTLLRCVGWLARASVRGRKGAVGPSIETPGAQCLGGHRFRYALIPYAGHWEEARIWEPALELNTVLVGTQVQRSRGLLRSPAAFLSVDPPELLLSTVKLAEEEDALVLRLHNLTDRPQSGAVELFADISAVAEVNLNEEEQERLVLSSSRRFAIQAGPFQIKTVKVCLKKPSPAPARP